MYSTVFESRRIEALRPAPVHQLYVYVCLLMNPVLADLISLLQDAWLIRSHSHMIDVHRESWYFKGSAILADQQNFPCSDVIKTFVQDQNQERDLNFKTKTKTLKFFRDKTKTKPTAQDQDQDFASQDQDQWSSVMYIYYRPTEKHFSFLL